ncbi:HAD family hydrolase [Porphyrobacter sp. SLTP]|uniref:sulfotransferase-like domain-containing protein n=1 Tax=Porphyrobacter sp. SLTP TaxID=2683266 RepID=UPI0018F8C5E7|nr:HAD family hydrolase [Porphyrobacter sp. SLTP]
MTIRIAMWSGPRNLSTAMMRAFENRADCVVSDEPFYAAYLATTGLVHPMQDEVLASQPNDWREVAAQLAGPLPKAAGKGDPAVWYQKHMTHHMLPEFGLDWTADFRHAFLIRAPARVLNSYVAKREDVALADIGLVRQVELFDRFAHQTGAAPPVVDSDALLRDPEGVLRRLCTALAIPFDPNMLHWPKGRRASDGVWAPAWYASVEQSTGFAVQSGSDLPSLPAHLQRIADAALPFYERLAAYQISV